MTKERLEQLIELLDEYMRWHKVDVLLTRALVVQALHELEDFERGDIKLNK